MKKLCNSIFQLIILGAVFTACQETFDINEALSDAGTNDDMNIGDTVYIRQSPDWEGFNKPQDILIGREPFIYVADTDNDQIVMMNVAGTRLGSLPIKQPVAIAQDHKMNLIVCAEFDTVISGTTVTYGAIYKVDMVSAAHNIGSAQVKRVAPVNSFEFLKPDRRYTGAAVFYDNSYFITRTGPNNSNQIDPDNAILIYEQIDQPDGSVKDTMTGRVIRLAPEGTGLLSMNNLSSITSFPGTSFNILLTMKGENSFKTQWLRYFDSREFTGYQSNLTAFNSDMMMVDRFGSPEGACLDNSNNIYVADSEKDSIFQFNSFGDELHSFGGPVLLDSPHDVGYYNKNVYVVDTGNDRILRFVLSTEIE